MPQAFENIYLNKTKKKLSDRFEIIIYIFFYSDAT
jgi:hypothetical protein